MGAEIDTWSNAFLQFLSRRFGRSKMQKRIGPGARFEWASGRVTAVTRAF